MRDSIKIKEGVINELVQLMNEYPIIGTVNMENMPTPQLQNMRATLRKDVIIKMTKKRIIKLALKKAKKDKKGIEDLEIYLKGMPALLFTKNNPFTLFKTLKKNKSTAPAKAGQIAPKDIIIKSGPTPFAPGPVIGELGAIGVKAGIENGKVAIKQDAVVVKEGEEIKSNVAGLLTRLKIEPMEIGLDLTATYEDGTIFTKTILDIDENEYISNIEKCAKWSFNLAMETSSPTKETIELLLIKSFSIAKNISIDQNILTDLTTEEIIMKLERIATTINSQLDLNFVKESKSTQQNSDNSQKEQEIKKAENQNSNEEAKGGQ